MMISLTDFLNVYVLVGCLATLLWIYSQSTYNHWRKLNVKYLKPVPLFGNTAKLVFLLETFHEAYHKLYAALGNEPYGGFYQMREPQLMVKDPKLVSAILIKDFKNFHDRGMSFFVNQSNRNLNPLTMHILFSTGDRWKVLRLKMSPVFTSGKLKRMYEHIFDCMALMNKFIDKQMDGQDSMDVALKDLFGKLTVDVIGSCAFGIECNSFKANEKFTEMCKKVFKTTIREVIRVMLTSYPKLLDLLKFPDMREDVKDFFLNLTSDTIEYRRKNGVKRNDLMQLLMELQNSHVDPRFAVGEQDKKVLKNEEFDEIDIAANLLLFFVAGYQPTSSTLSYCLYELALNQDIQDRVRSEVQQLRSEGETLNYENLRKLTYMDAVISETLRKYPPATALYRMCTEDYIIPGTKTRVTAGTQVIIPVWSIHHDWKNYPNPEVFNPERFLGDNKQSIPNGVYLPFGVGPRYCLGQRFAEMEIKITLAEMILKFNVKPCSKTEIPLKYMPGSFLLQSQCGTWVNIEKRKN